MLIKFNREDLEPAGEPFCGYCDLELVSARVYDNIDVILDFVIIDLAAGRRTDRTVQHEFTLQPDNAAERVLLVDTLQYFRFGSCIDQPLEVNQETLEEKIGYHYFAAVRLDPKRGGAGGSWRQAVIDVPTVRLVGDVGDVLGESEPV